MNVGAIKGQQGLLEQSSLIIVEANRSRFLQRQHDLAEERGRPMNRVELFKEIQASRTGEFLSQALVNAM